MTVATLADRLAEIEVPTAHLLEVRGDPWHTRVRAAGAHRAVPASVAVVALTTAARAAWRVSPATRDRARQWSRAVLGDDAPGDRVDTLARRHLIDSLAVSELQWRPWIGKTVRIDGVEHLDEARRLGRGAIVALPHVGPLVLFVHALCARGERPYFARKHSGHAGVVYGANGRWIKSTRGAGEDAGCRYVSRGRSSDLLAALLERGETVVTAWDVPGRGDATLLSRPARISAGVAHLSAATGAPVVPAVIWRERATVRARLGTPIVPGAGGAGEVLRELAADLDATLGVLLPQAHEILAEVLGGHDATGAAT